MPIVRCYGPAQRTTLNGESELGKEVEGEKEKSMEGSWADLTLLAARRSPYYHPFMLYPRPKRPPIGGCGGSYDVHFWWFDGEK